MAHFLWALERISWLSRDLPFSLIIATCTFRAPLTLPYLLKDALLDFREPEWFLLSLIPKPMAAGSLYYLLSALGFSARCLGMCAPEPILSNP